MDSVAEAGEIGALADRTMILSADLKIRLQHKRERSHEQEAHVSTFLSTYRLSVMKVAAASALVATAGLTALAAGPARAAFPGAPGKIAYTLIPDQEGHSKLGVMNEDGSGKAVFLADPAADLSKPTFSMFARFGYQRFNSVEINEIGDQEFETQILVRDLFSTNPPKVIEAASTATGTFVTNPSISPFGDRVAYQRQTQDSSSNITQAVVVERVDGTGSPITIQNVVQPEFSSDNRHLAVSQQGNLAVVDLDGTRSPTPVTTGGRDFNPDWHPTEDTLVFDRDRNNDAEHEADSLVVKRANSVTSFDNSSELFAVDLSASNPDRPQNPVFSPNGKAVAFEFRSRPRGTNEFDIATIRAEFAGDSPRILTADSSDGFLDPEWVAAGAPDPDPDPDAVTCKGQKATFTGTPGADSMTGTGGQDVIVGLGGNDRISGAAGNDIVCGGAGDDRLSGGAGTDSLRGEGGNDTVLGGPGKDRLSGGAGADTCNGGKAKDKSATCESGTDS